MHGEQGVALHARHFDEPSDRIADEAEGVLESDSGSVDGLTGAAAHHVGNRGGAHRRCDSYLVLASARGAGDVG